jgi:dipeptidyl aminopeptidase/acylaminoacyl peptidase
VADFTEHLSASASTATDKSIALNEYEEIWFEGAEGVQIHGWVVKPYGWKTGDKAKTWPALLLIHGGPQGAWEDQWSTRWNPQVFASQGYFAIAINPTGSTTYGQAFTDAIAENWGGRPYVDLKKGWDHVLNKYPEIDPERAGAAGGSYGGYAVNWIAGHPEFGFNFKALFSHDGIFDTRAAGYTTEELFFHIHEFGGTPYSKKGIENAEKWNPRNHVDKFSVPQLIVHGSKDYRLAETEGLAMFTALQLRHVPSKLVIFPDENHWVLNPSNSLEWHTQVFEWFDTYVGAGKRE